MQMWLLFVWDGGFLCDSGSPGIHFAGKVGLDLTDIPLPLSLHWE